MQSTWQIALLGVILAFPQAGNPGEQAKPVTIWEGEIHFGDNPEAYPKITSAGMVMQVPFKAESGKKYRLVIKASDVETLAGDGHYAEVLAHYQEKGKTKEVSVQVFRIKDDAGLEKDFSFEFSTKLATAPLAYYSVKISVDTSIRFGLWDDFLVKRVTVERLD